MKRPAFQFYPADWRKDVELQSCSMAAQGLWINAMCLAHECEPYGHLTINGKPMTPAQLGRQVGLSAKESEALLEELLDAGVARKTEEGMIYSSRMVRDERLRNVRAESGGKGGNPDLVGGYNVPGYVYVMQRSKDMAVKIGASVDPSKRIYKVRQQLTGQQVTLLSKHLVDDMGAIESECHTIFSSLRLDSEWFNLDADGLLRLENHLKAKSKGNLTPSSSSSSSTSSPSLRSGDTANKSRTSPSRRNLITLSQFLEACKAQGVKPVPLDAAVRDYCRAAGISDEMLQIAWLVFKDRHLNADKDKRYKDWGKAFANSVKDRWYKLWFDDAGEVKWTSTGLQEKRVVEARLAEKKAADNTAEVPA